DEIGELPLEMQAKLLTVLQDHEVRRVGGSRAKKVDVRVVAATNKDLKEMVKQGTFREDLFFRLNVLSLHVPPLRERLDDIEPLANMFLSNIAKARGQKQQQLSPAVVRGFHEYHWPGNVRELENVLERATAFTNAEILSSQDIDLTFSQSTKREEKSELCFLDLGGYSLEDVERKAIEDTLRLTSGHKAKAAKMLGISTKSIYNKIERYGI
ncbi:MAG: sigma-54-dependent Fis family transcriptional regulator, partial [Bdellovibrionales bacterium]|nr:sigma-54-dependent Fis family transcriptional regulator [Bdellovibrionales bacterium]